MVAGSRPAGGRTAVQVVWLADGGRGFWTVFQRCFQAVGATAILDFYHAAQNLYKGAAAWLDGRTRACQQWFAKLRHQLRHGHEQQVLAELAALVETEQFPESARETLTNGNFSKTWGKKLDLSLPLMAQ